VTSQPSIARRLTPWEDVGFVQAVKATVRKKLIMTALWMEACLTFPALTLGEQDRLSTCRLRYGR
jgi:hypothetical protein